MQIYGDAPSSEASEKGKARRGDFAPVLEPLPRPQPAVHLSGTTVERVSEVRSVGGRTVTSNYTRLTRETTTPQSNGATLALAVNGMNEAVY